MPHRTTRRKKQSSSIKSIQSITKGIPKKASVTRSKFIGAPARRNKRR